MEQITNPFNISSIPGLQNLWVETLGDPEICIAILDGPVDQSHPSLKSANLTQVETLVSNISIHGSATKHGTHIASVIFGQHDGPVRGIAPQCRGIILPIFNDGKDGAITPCSQVDLARAIAQSVQHGAHIINISGGELRASGSSHPLLANAVRECEARGVLIVAAAGNQGCECLHIPGALPSVLAVGAMDSQGNPLEFSNWGEKYQTQGILAPGLGILGATSSGGVATKSGTSYATPIVTGIAALFLSLQLKDAEKIDPQLVRSAILGNAIGCEEQPVPNCRRLLAGRLNIKGAMKQIIMGGSIMSEMNEIQENNYLEVVANENEKTYVSKKQKQDVDDIVTDKNASNDKQNLYQSSGLITEGVRNNEEIPKQELIEAGQVSAAECGCGNSGVASPQLVFAIGQLGFDFGTESRRNSIIQSMATDKNLNPNPHDPMQLLAYIEKNPWEAASIIWTLNFDSTPIYAIQGQGAIANEVYKLFREFLVEQTKRVIERVSIGGHIVGQVRLMSGQVVPVIWPEIRCMYSWNTAELIKAVCGKPPAESAQAQEKKAYSKMCEPVINFLERVYHELRNFGTDHCHRAINFSATNALNVANIFQSVLEDNMQLDSIEYEPSPICRPDSDCVDVKLIFFDPENQLTRARKVYRFTVDVTDVCPVMVGQVRSWFVR